MGRIIAQTKVTNLTDESKSVQCGMLVDTGAAALILPAAWRDRLGAFPREEQVALVLANGKVVQGSACAPVEIQIEGFRPVVNEVMFVETEGEEPSAGGARGGLPPRMEKASAGGARGGLPPRMKEPLLGYVILEQAQAAVDTLRHRLVPVPYLDMK